MTDNTEIKVKSLQKALEILNYFTEKPILGVTEISEHFGLYKSTVHNILSTLKAMEYLEQDEASGKYCLGIQIFNLSKSRLMSLMKLQHVLSTTMFLLGNFLWICVLFRPVDLI